MLGLKATRWRVAAGAALAAVAAVVVLAIVLSDSGEPGPRSAGGLSITLKKPVRPRGQSRFFAVTTSGGLPAGVALVPTTGGSPRLILRSPRGGDFDSGYERPAWSSDGRSLAFFRIRLARRHEDEGDTYYDSVTEVWVARSDGRGLRRISGVRLADDESAGRLSWSPDGRYLALGSYVGKRAQVWLVSVATGRQATLVENGSDPAWSPDGRWVAFGNRGVWLIRPDGADLHRLTPDGFSPAWSPDSRQLAFATSRDHHGQVCFEDGCHPSNEIYRIGLDGHEMVRLTRTLSDERAPTWAPSGDKVAFVGEHGIEAVSLNGTCRKTLATLPLVDAVWQPGHMAGSSPC